MKFKKIISVFLIIATILTMLLITLTSCNKKSDDNAEIQLWYYDYIVNDYSIDIGYLIKGVEEFCQKNEIPLKIFKYDKKTLSYDDYTLKRNLAAASGNMIIIEDARYIWDLSKHHADYKKLDSYNNLFNEYKDKFCIPVGINGSYGVIDPKTLEYYGIKLNKSIVTNDEYLELKQEMKQKGANFKINWLEYFEKLKYYQNKYDLLYVNDTSEILNNADKFRNSLKYCITDICDEFIKNGDFSKLVVTDLEMDNNIYDESSGLNLYYENAKHKGLVTYFWLEKEYDSIIDNILVTDVLSTKLSPCFYMNKKITNKRIWELANFITGEDMYKIIKADQATGYSPVRNDKVVREVLELDDNLKYKGPYKVFGEEGKVRYTKITELINEISDVVMTNKDSREFFSKKLYADKKYVDKIKTFIETNLILLSENNYDYKSEEMSKILDTEINEFVKNFNIHND